MIPNNLVATCNSEIIDPMLFIDAFGVTEDGIDAIVARLKQETPGRRVTNSDVEQVLLQFYAQDEGAEGRSIDAVFDGQEATGQESTHIPEEITTIRVYGDDNSTIDPEYLAVVNGRECYITELLQVAIPEWNQARVRLGRHIVPPHPGLLDGTVTASQGWHFHLEKPGILEITWREDQEKDQYSEYAEKLT